MSGVKTMNTGGIPRFLTLALVMGVISTLASSAASLAAGCPNEALRQVSSSTQLPDCRAYEMVSPVDKNGWQTNVVNADGTRVLLKSLGGFAGSNQLGLEQLYMSEYGAAVGSSNTGWSVLPVEEPAGHLREGLPAATADLSKGLLEYISLSTLTPNERLLYVAPLPKAGAPVEIGPVFSPEALTRNPTDTSASPSSQPSVSDDLTSVLFTIEGPTKNAPGVDYLWPGDTTVGNTGTIYGGQGFVSLYEYRGTGNSTPALVGVNGNGQQLSQCGVTLGYPAEDLFSRTVADEIYNAISADGSRVFFAASAATLGPSHDACTPEGAGSGPKVNELYGRIFNATTNTYSTVAISEPSEEDCLCDTTPAAQEAAPEGAVFQGASEDGSKVFFLSGQKLLPGAEATNLFEYNFDAEAEGKPSKERVTLIAPKVLGVARVSEDGSHVYFVSEGALTSTPNPAGDVAHEGQDNLYGYTAGQLSFVGQLASGDAEDWQRRDVRPVDATPNGTRVVFTSTADLTHEGTDGVRQVFEYDATNKTLTRVSASHFERATYGTELVMQNYAENQNPAPQLSSISADGAYIVFQSRDVLVPQATAGYFNMYEYHEGQLSLISDGRDPSFISQLAGIDSTGANIYFTTVDGLIPQDTDTQQDVYDARIDGGVAPAKAIPACEGDGCQGPLAQPPLLDAVTSASQQAGEKVVDSASPKSTQKTKASARNRAKTKRKKKRTLAGKHRRRPTRARVTGGNGHRGHR